MPRIICDGFIIFTRYMDKNVRKGQMTKEPRVHDERYLEQALGLGNRKEHSFHSEEELRGRIGHNMKAFLMAYCLGAGRKVRASTLKRQWYVLKGAGSEALEIISSVQRRRAFLLLERQGCLYRSVSTESGKKIITFKFTEKGLALQERYSDEAKLERLSSDAVSGSVRDSKVHVVSWDIPEALRRKRALFRHFVRSLGFRLLHKSFFIGDINVVNFLAKAARLLDIEKFIHCGIYQSTVYAGVTVGS